MFADSPLLHVEGRGEVTLNDRYDSELHFNFVDSSLDPYLRFFARAPAAFNRFILGGSLDVSGPLKMPHELAVAAVIDDATLTMFDYDLRNDGPVNVSFRNDAFRIGQLKLTGADTNLELSGGADAGRRMWNLSAKGGASLSILKLAFPTITTSGSATLNASLVGSFDAPSLTGEAVVTDGRLRPPASVHGLEAVNGRFVFEEAGVNLSGVTGRVAGGDVVFGGAILREGYRLTEYNLTAIGRSLRLRYPSGFNSTVNMDLRLVGPLTTPRLIGNVEVLRMTLTGGGGDAGLLGLAAAGTTGVGLTTPTSPGPPPQSTTGAVALDVEVTSPRMAFIDTRDSRIEGTADLRLTGTFDRPIMNGSIDIVSGHMQFAGNRIFVRESSVDFRSTDRIEPHLDFNADSRVRTPGQTVDISIRITGPPSALTMTLNSDPPLPTTDIISLLAGGTTNLDTASQRALSSPQESQQRMMQTMAALLLASPISSRVGDVFERTGAVDVVQITPLLAGEVAFQQLNPSARITLGKRISPRVFLTYSRTLGASATQDEVILLEYDQNDRVSWILSRNENRTFALDFRIRYVH
jgi:translocation and assembly module TamB